MQIFLTLALPAILAVAPPTFPGAAECLIGPTSRMAPVSETVSASRDAASPRGFGVAAQDYRALWESGATFEAFLAEATARRELWDRNVAESLELSPELMERARRVGGTWHILAVAIDACSDSVNTIPYLARLAAEVEGLEFRVIDPERGRAIMEAHPTPDGRAATPTVLLLDEAFDRAGCLIERPTELQNILLENPEGRSQRELHTFKMGWYERDAGRTTVGEFVDILESAATGEVRCGT